QLCSAGLGHLAGDSSARVFTVGSKGCSMPSIDLALASVYWPTTTRSAATVPEVPVFRGPEAVQLVECQAIAGKPRLGPGLNHFVDLPDAISRFLLGKLLACWLAFLQEVLFPEGPAAEHAAGS